MVFKSFHTQIVLRVLFLAATIATLVYLAMETTLYATSILVAFITAYQVWSLMNFVDRTNLSLSRFFDSIRYADFLQTNQTGKVSGSFEELTRAMDQVSDAFQSARAEKEENFRYLQTIIHHVGIGLLAYSDNGDVELMNPAARRLLQISQLRNLSNLAGVSDEFEGHSRQDRSRGEGTDQVLIGLRNAANIYSCYENQAWQSPIDSGLPAKHWQRACRTRDDRLAESDPRSDSRDNEFDDADSFACRLD
ncbi:MAG: hypothetical protein IPH59_12580 [bacterium]|nr:hypothetical protein [bacterium]